jgi:hypothetical protein
MPLLSSSWMGMQAKRTVTCCTKSTAWLRTQDCKRTDDRDEISMAVMVSATIKDEDEVVRRKKEGRDDPSTWHHRV